MAPSSQELEPPANPGRFRSKCALRSDSSAEAFTPERNTREFIAALPEYYAHGLRAVEFVATKMGMAAALALAAGSPSELANAALTVGLPLTCQRRPSRAILFGIEADSSIRDVYGFECTRCGRIEARGVLVAAPLFAG